MQPLQDFDFRMRPAPAGSEDAIEAIWYARGTVPYTREQISPTGSTVAVVVLGDAIRYSIGPEPGVRTTDGFLAGPHDRPAINEPTGETFAVGIVTTAVGCTPVFGVAPADLRGRVLPLADAWSGSDDLRRALVEADDPDAMLEIVATRLAGLQLDDRQRRCAGWVAELEADPTLPIGELADRAGLSHAHLVAEFSRIVGLTPRVLSRLLRIRRVLAAIDIEPDTAWTEIAHRHEWFDQAHFIRDFKRHTGVTPSAYVAAQKAAFLPDQEIAGSGVGFVPET